jgi:hypothetical protein
MRILLVALTFGLLATALPPTATAEALCLPGVPEARATCVAAGPCRTDHARGVCAGASTAVGGAHASCVQRAEAAGSCHAGAAAMGHHAGAGAGCARDHGVHCSAGAGADGRGIAGASLHAGRAGVCAGAASPAAHQGARQCLPSPLA